MEAALVSFPESFSPGTEFSLRLRLRKRLRQRLRISLRLRYRRRLRRFRPGKRFSAFSLVSSLFSAFVLYLISASAFPFLEKKWRTSAKSIRQRRCGFLK